MKKRGIAGLLLAGSMLMMTGCSNGNNEEAMTQLQSQYDEIQSKYDAVQSDLETLQSEYDEIVVSNNELSEENTSLQTEKEELQKQYDALQEEKTALESEYASYQAQVQEYLAGAQTEAAASTGTYYGGYTAEQVQALTAEYRTDVTYEQLLHDPETYQGVKFALSGQIVMANASDDAMIIYLAVDNDYTQIMAYYAAADWANYGVAVGAYVTVYGTGAGLSDVSLADAQSYVQYLLEAYAAGVNVTETETETASETETETETETASETETETESETETETESAFDMTTETGTALTEDMVPIATADYIVVIG